MKSARESGGLGEPSEEEADAVSLELWRWELETERRTPPGVAAAAAEGAAEEEAEPEGENEAAAAATAADLAAEESVDEVKREAEREEEDADGEGTDRGPSLEGIGQFLAADPQPAIDQVTNGGINMPAFGDRLAEDEIVSVVDYITTTFAE